MIGNGLWFDLNLRGYLHESMDSLKLRLHKAVLKKKNQFTQIRWIRLQVSVGVKRCI